MIAVAPVDGRAIDLDDFHKFLEEKLPKYAMPRFVNIVPEIPKTATHRVMKKELERAGITPETIDLEKRMKKSEPAPAT
jgi:crotonobetaine/carnitine-CoA ligase